MECYWHNTYTLGLFPFENLKNFLYKTIAASYELEYGTDSLEIHIDDIQPGDRVLIHDDVLASGGTAEAVCKLVEQLGGEIVQLNF